MLQELRVGQIVNTHGVRGEVKIKVLSEDPRRFESLKKVKLETQNNSLGLKEIEFLNVRYQQHMVIAKLKGIDTIDMAEKLKGIYLVVDRKDAIQLPEGSYFICDIIGMEVYDHTLGLLGTIAEVLETGSNDVYVIRDKHQREVLLPALKSVIQNISLEENKMSVILPKGLLDDEI